MVSLDRFGSDCAVELDEGDEDEDNLDCFGTLDIGPRERYECVERVKTRDSEFMDSVKGGGVFDKYRPREGE